MLANPWATGYPSTSPQIVYKDINFDEVNVIPTVECQNLLNNFHHK